ncbi:uncharacterized protein LOC119835467 [Zerene cesonia]|uniref:uncharacterized protein LOC119835467 n=1 Tax=Zerene cesonia TaxID=33412 RepID=UPI0018E54924|nr:uncharacterized protein LOC119835467 [Zerene cesonia]
MICRFSDNSLGSASSAVEDSTVHEAQGVEESSAFAPHTFGTIHTSEATIEATSSSTSSSSRKRNSEATLTKDILKYVRDQFKRPARSPPPHRLDDRFNIFGKAIAFKLNDLAKTQRILAEKIINHLQQNWAV